MTLGILSEINFGHRIVEPIVKALKTKKKGPKMLEEQIRDTLPSDTEPKEEEDEKF
jgi:hypothetical protein